MLFQHEDYYRDNNDRRERERERERDNYITSDHVTYLST